MNIAAVIVTYNRLELLKECMEAFFNQTRRPNELIVVNNASTDGTDEFLREWVASHNISDMEIIVVSMEKNEGGSGGFYAGTKKALEIGADWVWVSDDDAETHICEISDIDQISAICAQVQTGGKPATSNRGIRKMGPLKMEIMHVPKSEYLWTSFECNHFSYVGVFMQAIFLREVGLIHPEYFIWRDDVEHSWRLSSVGKIICYPDMIVNHKIQQMDYQGISWKTYYGYRNDLLMYKEHGCKLYYITKTLTMLFKGLCSINKRHFELYVDAIKAAHRGEGGINQKYLPGMKL
jgi:GT2 family glycosyltransferase